MSQADYAKMQELEVEMRKVLAEAMTSVTLPVPWRKAVPA